METRTDRKPKVLCLHGYGQNEKMFRLKSRGFRSSVEDLVDLVYMTAPLPTLWTDSEIQQERDIQNQQKIQRIETENEPFNWWRATDPPVVELHGIQQSIDYVLQILEEQGPFVGIMGFSQGAALAAILCHVLENPQSRIGRPSIVVPKFGIFFGGYRVEDKEWSRVFSRKCAVASLHVIGTFDTRVSPQRSQTLAECFESPTLHQHGGGHFIPITPASKSAYRDFVKKQIGTI